jgi:tetratricopeptide (TPR) repeat protein
VSRAQFRDAADWLERAPLGDATVPMTVRAAALAAAGAIAYFANDDVDRAESFWHEALELRREQDDPCELGAALTRLGIIAWHRGDLDGAIAYHVQAMSLYDQAGDEGARLNGLHFLGETYRDRGDYDESQRVLEETAALARSSGRNLQLTSTLHSLGDLALDREDPATALARFAEALEYAVETGHRRVQLYCVAGIACARLQQGDDRAAVRLWGIAEDQERQLGFRMLSAERRRYEHVMASARARLGDAYDIERRSGAGLTLEQAVAEARASLPR